MDRNPWSPSIGMCGHHASDYAVAAGNIQALLPCTRKWARKAAAIRGMIRVLAIPKIANPPTLYRLG
jgi:hypothetical protein